MPTPLSPTTPEGVIFLKALSRVFGWIYFLCWSLSFYPQPLLNWRRRSTIGLTIDFPLANVLGFFFYSLSTVLLYSSTVVRDEYAHRHPHAPEPTVQLNDVAFAVHGFLLCAVTISQFSTLLWPFAQGRRRPARVITGLCLGCCVAVLWAALMAGLRVGDWGWLDVTYAAGYCKLAITVAKYVPQAWDNYRRGSTAGWSIGQILLDLPGSVLSNAQLFIDSALENDWSGITGNPIKFGLANVSMAFDVLFIVQHFILYPQRETKEPRLDEREALLRGSDEQARFD